jgi:hypothetical protein
MGTLLRRWVPALSLLAAASVPADAQRIDPDRIFEVTVEVNGRMMSAMIREGSFLRLTVRETDEYHFSPVLQPGSTGRALVAVSLGTTGQPQTRRVVERLVLSPGVPVALRTAPTLRIVLDEISRARQSQSSTGSTAGSGAFFRFTSSQNGQCCVCCEGACACACGVSMWCGHCCTQGCCDPMLPTSNDRIPILTGSARFASFTRRTCTRGSLLERAPTPRAADARIALR